MKHLVMYKLNCTEEFLLILSVRNNGSQIIYGVAVTSAQIQVILIQRTWKQKLAV